MRLEARDTVTCFVRIIRRNVVFHIALNPIFCKSAGYGGGTVLTLFSDNTMVIRQSHWGLKPRKFMTEILSRTGARLTYQGLEVHLVYCTYVYRK